VQVPDDGVPDVRAAGAEISDHAVVDDHRHGVAREVEEPLAARPSRRARASASGTPLDTPLEPAADERTTTPAWRPSTADPGRAAGSAGTSLP
jgi:hypothetical protein